MKRNPWGKDSTFLRFLHQAKHSCHEQLCLMATLNRPQVHQENFVRTKGFFNLQVNEVMLQATCGANISLYQTTRCMWSLLVGPFWIGETISPHGGVVSRVALSANLTSQGRRTFESRKPRAQLQRVPNSFLFLVVRPGAPSSVLVPSSDARSA